jgi:hypothetical protein
MGGGEGGEEIDGEGCVECDSGTEGAGEDVGLGLGEGVG